MKKLKIVSITLIFITFLFLYQTSVYCMPIEGLKIAASSSSSTISVDSIMDEADDFIKDGEASSDIDETQLGETSDFLYNLLLGIGIIAAVGVGVVLGIKYVVASASEKAEIKKSAPIYVVAAVFIFAAVNILAIIQDFAKDVTDVSI